MLRLRLASLALASCVLLTMSGCCAFCEDGRMFPRLFRSNSQRPFLGASHGTTGYAPVGMQGPDCDCNHGSQFPPMPGYGMDMGFGAGMPMTMPSAGGTPTPIPITNTNVPAGQSPALLKLPQQASPTPYFPSAN